MGRRSAEDSRPFDATLVAPNDDRPPQGGATLPGTGDAPSMSGALSGTEGLAELQPGDVLGRYRIERKVGEGGMGEVYAAHDPQLDRRVAIKVLPANYRTTDSAARLVREAQALAKLTHPNVVAVHDAGEVDDRVFLAMQFVEGVTLGQHLDRNRLAPREVIALFVAAGRGLAAAHAAGLVHRDFKPANVLIDAEGHVAVTDFGLARASHELADAERTEPGVPAIDSVTTSPSSSSSHSSHSSRSSSLDSNMTQAGALIGTPAYMAPEQHNGERGSARSDQFAFAVALWEALFHRHPYVPPGHDRVTSPFEFTHLITEGSLSPPASGHAVPRRAVAALSRALERAPERRWPSVAALLDELEPPAAPYRTAVVALAAAATVGAGAVAWLSTHGVSHGPSCKAEAGDRMATAWSKDRAQAIAARFAETKRPYAAAAAKQVADGLDRYAARWSELGADACAAGRASDPAARVLAAQRAACLDGRLTALREVADRLGREARGEIVDNAANIAADLPSLDDCADARALAANGAPTPQVAAALPALEARLATAQVHYDAGLYRDALGELELLAKEAAALGWKPLEIDVSIVLAATRYSLLEPTATATAIGAAELATREHLDRAATRAWTLALQAAATSGDRGGFDALDHVAEATAAGTGDPDLIARVHISYARGLSRLKRWSEAEPACRAALAEAEKLGAPRTIGNARDCMIEVLSSTGKRQDLRTLLDQMIAEREAQAGPDHPAIADYLQARCQVNRLEGHDAEARADAERALQIREHAFGADSIRTAESLAHFADFQATPAEVTAMLERALAVAEDPARGGPRGPTIAAQIHVHLGMLAAARGHTGANKDAIIEHFGKALALQEQMAGPDSIEVASVLVMYGQHVAEWDLDGGTAMLRRSLAIMEKAGDTHAIIVRGALTLVLSHQHRWAEVLPLVEANIADAERGQIDPGNLAIMRETLARALIATKGDRKRAKQVADAALADFTRAGESYAQYRAVFAQWKRANHL